MSARRVWQNLAVQPWLDVVKSESTHRAEGKGRKKRVGNSRSAPNRDREAPCAKREGENKAIRATSWRNAKEDRLEWRKRLQPGHEGVSVQMGSIAFSNEQTEGGRSRRCSERLTHFEQDQPHVGREKEMRLESQRPTRNEQEEVPATRQGA